jgi:hypothetical protein
LKYNNFGMHSCHMEEVFDQWALPSVK